MVQKLWHKTQMRRQTVGPFHSSQFLQLVFIPLWMHVDCNDPDEFYRLFFISCKAKILISISCKSRNFWWIYKTCVLFKSPCSYHVSSQKIWSTFQNTAFLFVDVWIDFLCADTTRSKNFFKFNYCICK